ncbi:MAG: DUF2092 domain-containing protein [Cyanobacteria bacterium TGS_CYA1]|nr:DUF2092 domain-containing protein [Cyanobacteria bacterium TGS_CYA1]
MKTLQILPFLISFLAPYMMAKAVLAFDPPKHAYKATYDTVSANGVKSQISMAWNGKDIGVSRMTIDGQNLRVVSDFKNNKAILFLDEHKVAHQIPLDVEYVEFYDMDAYKKRATKNLGTKRIDGHNCQGYVFTDHGVSREVWIGDECKVVVVMKRPGADSNNLTLKTFDKAPPASEFTAEIPANYDVSVPNSTNKEPKKLKKGNN